MNKNIWEIGLKVITVVIVGGIIYKSAESILKNSIEERIISQLKLALNTALIWTFILGIVVILGTYLNIQEITSWIIDGIIITYVIQSLISFIAMIRTIVEIFRNKAYKFGIKIFNITFLGILQVILIPFVAMFSLLGLVSLLRSYLGLTHGGGFFDWVIETIKILLNPLFI